MGKPLPQLDYSHLQPFSPYGGNVEVRQSAKISQRTQEALYNFILSPSFLIKNYASHRFSTKERAPDRPFRTVFDIQKLTLIKKTEDENLMGILSGAAADYYTLDLLIALYPVALDGRLTQPYTIKIKRELLVQDQLSLAEKEFRQFEFLEKIIADIDKTVVSFIPNMR